MSVRALSALFVSQLIWSGCGELERPATETETEDGGLVHIEGLELRLDARENDEHLVIRARRATFDGLPGRAAGRLEGVSAHVEGAEPGDTLEASAVRASLGADDRVELEDATIVAKGFRLRAKRADIGLDGHVRGSDVQASLRVSSELVTP